MLSVYFEKQVQARPQAAAVVTAAETISYEELNRRANGIARLVGQGLAGAAAATPVGLLFDHGPAMITAILGVLKAGHVYVPLSADYPDGRLEYMLQHSGAGLLLCEESHRPRAVRLAAAVSCPVLDIAAAVPCAENPGVSVPPSQTAYILYTSGSTGRPKGVPQTHENVWYYTCNWTERLSITTADRLTLFSSFCHDGSVQDMFGALLNGAALYPFHLRSRHTLREISRFVQEEGITIWHSVPSLYSFFLKTLEGGEEFPALRFILLGGEPLREHEIQMTRRHFPHVVLGNVYGQTESSVDSIWLIRSDENRHGVILGQPLSATSIFVVNEEGEEVNTFETGEILVAGRHITPGYWRDPETSAKTFSHDPEYGILYWTGDLGRRLADGAVEFLGRRDSQIKIRGFRVELGEVESAMMRHPTVQEAVALAHAGADGEYRLTGYYVAGGGLDENELREFIARDLTDYMVPARFMRLEKMPLLPNNKIDRRALPEPQEEEVGGYVAPRDEVERRTVALWARILGREAERIGLDDDFFRLGGHSLKASELLLKAHREFGVLIDLPWFFAHSTARAMAERLRGGESPDFAAIPHQPQQEFYPVSSVQRRLFVLQQIDPDGVGYNLPYITRLRGPLDDERVAAAFAALCERHESLRTSFDLRDGRAVQIVQPAVTPPVERLDWRGRTVGEAELSARAAEFIRPFDLQRAPLWRVVLVRLAEEEHLLLVDMHHIISDGTSIVQLVQEFMALYAGLALPPLALQYKDFAAWQNRRLEQGEFAAAAEFWSGQFTASVPVLELPTDFPRPPLPDFSGRTVLFSVTGETAARLRELSAAEGGTDFMMLLALYTAWLGRLGGQEDVVVGTPVAGRMHADLNDVIGMFVNTLALRCRPRREQSFRAYLREVKTYLIEAFAHQEYPFEELVEHLPLRRDTGRNPLFDAMFIFQNMDWNAATPQADLGGLRQERVDFERRGAKFDLTMTAWPTADGFGFTLEYATALFRPETIARWIELWRLLLAAAVEWPDERIGELEWLPAAEEALYLQWNDSVRREFPGPHSVAGLLTVAAGRYAERPALRFRGDTIRYAELFRRAGRLAAQLREAGIGIGDVVALWTARRPEMIVAQVAVLLCGAAYLPLDGKFPAERVAFALQDSGARMVLTDDPAAAHRAAPSSCMVVDLSAAVADGAEFVAADVPATAAAYLIYTSGSTGRPKGVVVEHRQVVNFLHAMGECLPLPDTGSVLCLTSVSFDIFVLETLLPLTRGMTVVLADEELQEEPQTLAEWLPAGGVDIVQTTPSRLKMLQYIDPRWHCLRGVQTLLVGGEAFPAALLPALQEHFSGRVFNMYGPTETTVWSSVKELTRADGVTIGRPVANTSMYVLDRDGGLSPFGIPGEIWIGGGGVARGYHGRDDLTAERFHPDPFRPGERIYASGDLGFVRPDGEFVCLGRLDHQVKVRGYRVELEEIENRLQELPGVAAAAVAVHRDARGDAVLCAYVTGASAPGSETVRAHLAGSLPDYMVPAAVMTLEALPLLPSGKVDRRALPEPQTAAEAPLEPPSPGLETGLAEIWAEVLALPLERIGAHTNFFAAGGHSLAATIMTTRLHRELGVRVPLVEVFRTPTLRGLADFVQRSAPEEFRTIPAAPPRKDYELSPAQKSLYLMCQNDGGGTAYNMPMVLPLPDDVDVARLEEAFRRLIQRHEALRTSFPVVDGEVRQQVHAEVEFALERRDVAAGEEPGDLLHRLVRPFDLSRAPLARAVLLQEADGRRRLFVDMHHIVSDGTTKTILPRDFNALYEGRELPPLPLQYKDYAEWQCGRLQRGELDGHKAFWLERLAGRLPVLELPTDFPRPPQRDFAGDQVVTVLDAELGRAVEELGRREGLTLFMVLQAVFSVLLAQASGQSDIIIGSPHAGRGHGDLQNMIGLLMDSLLLRTRPIGTRSFAEFLQEVKRETLEAFAHLEYPFAELTRHLDFANIPGRSPITDVALIVQNMIGEQEAAAISRAVNRGEHASQLPHHSLVDLTLSAYGRGEHITLVFDYRTSLFRRESIERLAQRFIHILRCAVERPETLLAEVEPVSDAEKAAVIGAIRPVAPLSHPQQRIWQTDTVFAGSACNTVVFTVRLQYDPPVELLQQALNHLLHRQDALRLRLVQFPHLAQPLQYVAEWREERFPVLDFTGRELEFQAWVDDARQTPMPLMNSPLARFTVLRFHDGASGFALHFHHIVSDGNTVLMVIEAVDAACRALMAGETLTEAAAPSYREFIHDELTYLRSSQAGEDARFWEDHLLPPPEDMTLSRRGGDGLNPAGAQWRADLPPALREALHRFCRENRASIYKVMLSGLALYCARVLGRGQVVFSGAGNNRAQESHRAMCGMFVSTFPLIVDVPETASFQDFVAANGARINEIVKNHQRYPFDLLAETITARSGVNPRSLLNINIIGHPDIPDEHYRITYHFPDSEPTPLSLHININNRDRHGELELQWYYQTAQYDEADVRRVHAGVVQVLTQGLAAPQRSLAEIELLGADERRLQLEEWQGPSLPPPAEPMVHKLFAARAARTPQRIALEWAGGSWTYAELFDKARRLAGELRRRNVGRGATVAVLAESDGYLIAALWGVLLAGAAYLPIDPEYPAERVAAMLDDSRPAVLLGHGRLLSSVPFAGERLEVTGEWPEAGEWTDDNTVADTAYIIYTSGSTGRPKGVEVSHGNLGAYLQAFDHEFALTAEDVVVQQASYAFDAFVEEMYPVLLAGGRLVVARRDLVRDVPALADFMTAHGVTMITCSPLLLAELNVLADRLPTLRLCISGGDELKKEYFDRLAGRARVYNTYGPTETTVCATYHACGVETEAGVPIGRPIGGYRAYVLDERQRLLPVGAAGELCVGGRGVAKGYLGRPELTAEKFIADPFVPGERLYRTGDRVAWRADGRLEFLGRVDQQVKIRGYRIEPGEIESRLLEQPGITQAAVVAVTTPAGDKALCAYVAADGRRVEEWRAELRRTLPEYMVPLYFVVLDTLPRTVSGKLDRRALPAPQMEGEEGFAAPADEPERRLAAIWADLLRLDVATIGATANFFELGGHSLKAAVLMTRIQQEFGVRLPLPEIFRQPTIRGLARAVSAAAGDTTFELEPVVESEDYPLSFQQKRLWILQQMHETTTAFHLYGVVDLDRPIDESIVRKVLQILARRHESLRTGFCEQNGEPRQFIVPEVEIPFRTIDLRPLEAQSREEMRRRVLQEEIRTLFSLERPPLMRAAVIRTDEERGQFVFNMHHIVTDGWSMERMKHEFAVLYDALEKGGDAPLPPLERQYKDYAVWHNRRIADPAFRRQAREFWRQRLDGGFPKLEFQHQSDYPADGRDGAVYRYYIGPDTIDSLRAFADAGKVTPFTVMFAVYLRLLGMFAPQEEVMCSLISSGREQSALLPMVGFFVNSLLFRFSVSPTESFRAMVDRVQHEVVELLRYQSYPLEMVLEEERLAYPEVHASFNMLNIIEHAGDRSLAPFTAHFVDQHDEVKFDLQPYLLQYRDGFDIRWSFRKAALAPEFVANAAKRYHQLLDYFLKNPDATYVDYKKSSGKVIIKRKTNETNATNQRGRFLTS